jgi:hypothetical protein
MERLPKSPSRGFVEEQLAIEASLVDRISTTKQELRRLESELISMRIVVELSAQARLPQLNSDIIGEIVKRLDMYPDNLDFTLLPRFLSDTSLTDHLNIAWWKKAELAKLCRLSKA